MRGLEHLSVRAPCDPAGNGSVCRTHAPCIPRAPRTLAATARPRLDPRNTNGQLAHGPYALAHSPATPPPPSSHSPFLVPAIWTLLTHPPTFKPFSQPQAAWAHTRVLTGCGGYGGRCRGADELSAAHGHQLHAAQSTHAAQLAQLRCVQTCLRRGCECVWGGQTACVSMMLRRCYGFATEQSVCGGGEAGVQGAAADGDPPPHGRARGCAGEGEGAASCTGASPRLPPPSAALLLPTLQRQL